MYSVLRKPLIIGRLRIGDFINKDAYLVYKKNIIKKGKIMT